MNLFSQPKDVALGLIHMNTKNFSDGVSLGRRNPGQSLGRSLVSGKFKRSQWKKKRTFKEEEEEELEM